MPKFIVSIYMKNGKKYQGIKEAKDQYLLQQEYESKIKQWDKYSEVSGLTIIPTK